MPSHSLALSLVVAALIALLLALVKVRAPRLRAYLYSELVASSIIGLGLWYGKGYALIYCLARCFDLPVALWFSRPRAGTIISGLAFASIAVIGISGPVSLYAAIAILEGAIFAVAALSLALQRPLTAQTVIIGVMWMMLAMFDLVFALGYGFVINYWWPSTVFTMAFLIIAFTKEQVPDTCSPR